jgi:hypothetical protein
MGTNIESGGTTVGSFFFTLDLVLGEVAGAGDVSRGVGGGFNGRAAGKLEVRHGASALSVKGDALRLCDLILSIAFLKSGGEVGGAGS